MRAPPGKKSERATEVGNRAKGRGFYNRLARGVIFRSMMTYHVQFLVLVLAGWVNRQQQDVIAPQ